MRISHHLRRTKSSHCIRGTSDWKNPQIRPNQEDVRPPLLRPRIHRRIHIRTLQHAKTPTKHRRLRWVRNSGEGGPFPRLGHAGGPTAREAAGHDEILINCFFINFYGSLALQLAEQGAKSIAQREAKFRPLFRLSSQAKRYISGVKYKGNEVVFASMATRTGITFIQGQKSWHNDSDVFGS